jgi:hypothetical protein
MTLDRWGRKLDLRGLFPDMTENEALAVRASHEGDMTYLEHLDLAEIADVYQSLTDKGYLTKEMLTHDGWVTIQKASIP